MHGSVVEFIQDHLLAFRRIETGCTRAAYDHDEVPSAALSDQNQRTMAQWKLDHILYSSSTLVPLGGWSTLEADEHSCKVGLPNDRIPTDHLPIAALFERRPHPQLSEESKKTLVESLNEIENRQKVTLEAKNREVDERRIEIEQQLGEKNEVGETELQLRNMKKSKKKNRQPPEIIEHIRSSRAMMRDMKAEHRVERRQFVAERTILERMVLQDVLVGSLTKWAENP